MRSCIFYYVVSLSSSVNSLYSMQATWRTRRDKACTHCSAIHPGQLDCLKKRGEEKKSLVKRNPQQWTQKKCTMLTVFQIPLIALTTMRESRRFLLSSTSTNNRLTKASQLRFCSETKPPRPSKCSYWRHTKFFQLVLLFKAEGEKRAEKKRKMVTGLVMCTLLRSGRPFQAFWGANYRLKVTLSFSNIQTDSKANLLEMTFSSHLQDACVLTSNWFWDI